MKPKTIILCILTLFCAGNLKAQTRVLDTLINVGTYNLHFHIIKGKGLPILFESGGGDGGAVWDSITTLLHKRLGATLITYDRPGFGKSGLDTNKVGVVNDIEGLEVGLTKLGFDKKLFMVAHSLGGSYTMVFSARHPGLIKGAVFIDTSTPCYVTPKKSEEVLASYATKMDSFKRELPGVYYLLKSYAETGLRAAEAAPKAKMPITVIGSDVPPFKSSDNLAWKNCLRLFANERPNRKYILAKNTHHYVFFDDPLLVAREIVILYNKVRYK
ncbi:alpha/beta hydrolase [Mucilaginibacter conchicola]|uniref:Alpha/beta hydrolase n=1 Tax=Mucilaginibacter conchicola TaxID=2303333 RepID=A0A372NP42_9SPHI|nr:alpha/beta hydrolase [Mucilaginibacter conchicola]RFZ90135.1 alpha/beta hydrolase [Mucilaginibacter conchicola]